MAREVKLPPENTLWFICEVICLYEHELSKLYHTRHVKNCAVIHLSFATGVDLELVHFTIDLETIQKPSCFSYEY